MTRASREKEIQVYVAELKLQSWEVTRTAQGHWKAVPPDTTKPIIHFSASEDSHAQKNILRDLRRSGFIWPPPPKSKPPQDEEHIFEEFEDGPDSEEETSMSPAALCLVTTPPEAHVEKTMDHLFHELKEARSYLTLTEEHLVECRQALEAAKKAFDSAEIERAQAIEALKKKKAAFDAAFEVQT